MPILNLPVNEIKYYQEWLIRNPQDAESFGSLTSVELLPIYRAFNNAIEAAMVAGNLAFGLSGYEQGGLSTLQNDPIDRLSELRQSIIAVVSLREITNLEDYNAVREMLLHYMIECGGNDKETLCLIEALNKAKPIKLAA